ncbi:GAF domain-containing protein [Hymenobacter aerilatus]|uniref:GAF domain-containing protein n=1 Tax=Hymenobacter aerilatus TaxID=2932251 RepID=A0A8T9SXT0_9BACT|nr:GAF domain-containing protein [Hymenobacter aerilatus]UOR06527.1 GAF domain-containing protein [Hymenobacter aerilatus]
MNTTPEKIFDEYVALTARLFNLPISLISLVDEERVWFKASVGAPVGVTSLARPDSMCSAAILQDTPVFFSDYTRESCELVNPATAEALGLNFYAGTTLFTAEGTKMGVLAVIGREKRVFTTEESALLVSLAQLVSQTIELRARYLAAEDPDGWEKAQRELETSLDDNFALARYLATRTQGINLEDEEVAQLLKLRLERMGEVLKNRLEF